MVNSIHSIHLQIDNIRNTEVNLFFLSTLMLRIRTDIIGLLFNWYLFLLLLLFLALLLLFYFQLTHWNLIFFLHFINKNLLYCLQQNCIPIQFYQLNLPSDQYHLFTFHFSYFAFDLIFLHSPKRFMKYLNSWLNLEDCYLLWIEFCFFDFKYLEFLQHHSSLAFT